MPELPEVETIRRTLRPHVVGRTVEDVVVRDARLRRPVAGEFGARLIGRRIVEVRRLGKYLLFDLDDGGIWTVHFGMSGCLATSSAGAREHDHVQIRLSLGTRLVYNDPRRFGLMRVDRELPPEVHRLGVDPMADGYTPELLRRICRGRRRPIKNTLMDQHCIAGLGNIYASEVLFRAGVRPGRQSRGLRIREIEAIHEATGAVLREAIGSGGSSISDYRDGEGRTGYFQLQLCVYDREGEPCLRCQATIRNRVMSGRSTFYCPRCQA